MHRQGETVMHRRDISKALFASAAGSALVAQRSEAQTCTPPCYPQTALEAAVSVTPTNTSYPPGNLKRYGAQYSSSADDKNAWTNAVAVMLGTASVPGLGYIYAPAGTTYTSAISVIVSNTNASPAGSTNVHIYGDGVNATTIQQFGSPSGQLINIASANTATTIASIQILLENFTVVGVGNTVHGVSLQSVGNWEVRSVYITGFNRGLNLESALCGCVTGRSFIFNNMTGLYANSLGPTPVNLVSVNHARINANSVYGCDLVNGSSIRFYDVDFEGNGTAPNLSTGAIFLESTLSSGFGGSLVSFDDCWFEGNHGQCFRAANVSGLVLSFKDTLMVGNDSGADLNIAGAEHVLVDSSFMVTAVGSTSTIGSSVNWFTARNSYFGTLNDSSGKPIYENVLCNGGASTWGRHTQWTATLTGVGGAPTQAVDTYQQGDEIRMEFFTALTGTSSSTTATVTGFPAGLNPPFTRGAVMACYDNGVPTPLYCTIGDNVLTLGVGHTFGIGGVKGVPVGTFQYRL
jgi:hypothetical protein